MSMKETCSYCGEEGHSIQQCPKWKGSERSPPVRVEEMRVAMAGMEGLIRAYDFRLLEAMLYASKTTMKDATERRVFIQDFAAALNRRDLLGSEFVDAFCKHGYVYMEAASEHSSNPEAIPTLPFRWRCLKCGETFVTWVKGWPRCPKCDSKELKPLPPEQHSSGNKKFVVYYLDNMGREHKEEIEDDIAFYQRVRAEGLSVISIHKIK